MKVFITGATGYIGSAVVEQLKLYHDLIGLARSDDATAALNMQSIVAHHGDISNPESLISGVKRSDAVIHLAASRDANGVQWERDSVQTMLDAMKGTGKTFIYTSGASVVGDTGEQVLDETHPTVSDNFRAQIEQLVLGYIEHQVRPIIIRPSFVYGQSGGILPRYINHAIQNGVSGYVRPGDNAWSTIHVDDLARLYQGALEKASAGAIYNGAVGEPVEMCEIAQTISDVTSSELVAWTPDEAAKIIGGIAHLLTINLRVSAQRALDEIGWKPQEDTIQAYILKQNH